MGIKYILSCKGVKPSSCYWFLQMLGIKLGHSYFMTLGDLLTSLVASPLGNPIFKLFEYNQCHSNALALIAI